MTEFLRLIESEQKSVDLASSCSGHGRHRRFRVDVSRFAVVPGSPFAYWASDTIWAVFSDSPVVGSAGRALRQGLATADDGRFVRASWEVNPEAAMLHWRPFAKGGSYAPYYSDLHLLVLWGKDEGAQIEANLNPQTGKPRSNIWMLKETKRSYFGRAGITWPRRTSGLSFRLMPSGAVFADKGPAVFASGTAALGATSAVLNCATFALLVSLQLARIELAQSFEVGLIQHTPFPCLTGEDESALADLAHRAWSIKRSLDTRTETSHAFALPALLQVNGDDLAARTTAWSECVREAEAELERIQAEIDERCFELYGISDEDQKAIAEGFGGASEADEHQAENGEDEEPAERAGSALLAAELISWAVGVAFGRFDVRLATGERELPDEPDPFDPLPVCSAAMLTGDNGLPLSTRPSGYPLEYSHDGVLVDDPGHPKDMFSAVRHVFEVVFGERADALLAEAAALLDPRRADLRAWLGKHFFEFHLKRHSKSRRKAPTLWQLATPSSRYSVWLYAHRIDADSLFRLRADVIEPKLATEERKLAALVQDAGPAPTTNQGKAIAEQEAFVEELRTMREEVARVAPVWNPDLEDGIMIAMSPLWRLVPQHRAWQKELQTTFESLVAGKYDWAHLAMHLWPERVVPECATDRSIAIAHGLEDVFWVEGEDNKWTQRTVDQDAIDALVAERVSPAVADALRSLLEAPVATGGRGRTRRAGGTS